MHLYIFEDSGFQNLFPLTHLRPVYELRCGIFTLREKIQRWFPGRPVHLLCRDYLAESLVEACPEYPVNTMEKGGLFVNGAMLADADLASRIDMNREGVYVKGGRIVAVVVKGESLHAFEGREDFVVSKDDFEGLPTEEIDATMIEYPWDLIHHNAAQISADLEASGREPLGKAGRIDHAVLIHPERIYVAEDAIVKAGVVLDAEKGPIVIDASAEVMPHATIVGPAYVGPNSKIKIGAKIYEGTSIGEYCKVGGEVEESIFHSYSNKQHDGFLGHAYLGQWVNLGADTNNSDLKNNYGSVKVMIGGRTVDSGSMFVGSTIGDHAKTGINTMLNTGTVLGVFTNVLGGDFPPKFVPSFSWGGNEGFVVYRLDKALETAARVMARRNRTLTPVLEALYRTVFEKTRKDREF